MNEEFVALFRDAAQIILPPLMVAIGGFLIALFQKGADYLKAKAKEADYESISGYISIVEKVVIDCARVTNQTFVDSAKANGVFNEEAWAVAFEKTKTSAMALINEGQKQLIEQVYGDFEAWLNNRIESTVKELKNEC
jgi:hypothetical protein